MLVRRDVGKGRVRKGGIGPLQELRIAAPVEPPGAEPYVPSETAVKEALAIDDLDCGIALLARRDEEAAVLEEEIAAEETARGGLLHLERGLGRAGVLAEIPTRAIRHRQMVIA